MIILFLAPFVEHLTERTKHFVIERLPDKWPSYVSHHFAPLLAVVWSLPLTALYDMLVTTRYSYIEEVVILSGGSIIWYEISSLWKQKKREAIPLDTKGIKNDDIVI